jgi:hypothetical protein
MLAVHLMRLCFYIGNPYGWPSTTVDTICSRLGALVQPILAWGYLGAQYTMFNGVFDWTECAHSRAPPPAAVFIKQYQAQGRYSLHKPAHASESESAKRMCRCASQPRSTSWHTSPEKITVRPDEGHSRLSSTVIHRDSLCKPERGEVQWQRHPGPTRSSPATR